MKKRTKIDTLFTGFINVGYKSTNRIGQSESIQFLNKPIKLVCFNNILTEKLFQFLQLDQMENK